jgi:hypothetical protein
LLPRPPGDARLYKWKPDNDEHNLVQERRKRRKKKSKKKSRRRRKFGSYERIKEKSKEQRKEVRLSQEDGERSVGRMCKNTINYQNFKSE